MLSIVQGDSNNQGGFRYIRSVDALEELQQTLRDQYTHDLKVSPPLPPFSSLAVTLIGLDMRHLAA